MISKKIFLFGLDAAGKTTLSQAIRTGFPNRDNEPTKAFDITDLVIKNVEFKIWDAPGQKAYRKMWGKGMDRASIMTFVLDTSAKDRYEEALDVFNEVVEDLETRGVPLIFLFHKMDLEGAYTHLTDARSVFKLPRLTERKVYPLQTSVEDPASIDKLKETIAEIIEQERWG